MQKYIFFCRNSLILQKNVVYRMNLTTSVSIPAAPFRLSHQQKILLMGSCFAQEVGARLESDWFNCQVNPFGVLYNPLSISQALAFLLTDNDMHADDLFQHQGLWHSWRFHSSFSAADPAEALSRMNVRLEQARLQLEQLDVLILTWGTNRCYFYGDKPVANCHKVPQKQFVSAGLDVDTIVRNTGDLLEHLWQQHPRLQVILTVSPIRYVSYGLHESQLSKATLLMAADVLSKQFPGQVHYFPAYEIQVDELRDYRFYADDLVHPSSLAVQYIYQRFCETYVDDKEQALSAECRRLQRDMNHRPLHPESLEYQRFKEQLANKIAYLKQQYPYLKIRR